MAPQFGGIIVPMLTPLDSEERLDRPAVRRLVNFLVDGGVDGIFILGTQGEGAVLRTAARQELAETVVEAVGGRVLILAGVLETATARVVDEMHSLARRGLAGYVATTPFYFGGCSTAELYDHFRRIAEASDLPVLVYGIPQNTKVPLKAELVARLAEVPNIVGVKDSSGDWAEFQSILRIRRDSGFAVLQGAAPMYAISLLAGADGIVPAYANVHPRLLVDLMSAARRGDAAATFAYQARLDALLQARGRAVIHASKLLAKALGLMQDHVTSPLPRLSAEEAEQLLTASVADGFPVSVSRQ